MKARDVLALILLWIGVGAVAWGDEIGYVVGIVLTTLFYIYILLAPICAPKP